MTAFFDRVAKDDRLNSSHVSLYVALFQFWNISRFRNPVSIARNEVMRISKIGAKGTYHRCIKELHNFGYISYKPSHNPLKGSLVYLFNFGTTTEQPLELKRIKNGTSTEQLLNPSINNINLLNKVNSVNGHTHKRNLKNKIEETVLEAAATSQQLRKRKKGSAQKKKKISPSSNGEGRGEVIPPQLSEIEIFFESENQSIVEANKFFNYFQSNGWKVGGKAPMQDWKASARNWIINISQFAPKTKQLKLFTDRPGNPQTDNNKNYYEPL